MTKLPADAKVELVAKLRNVAPRRVEGRAPPTAAFDMNGLCLWELNELINQAADALEQSDAEQGEDAWQPIETAPHGEEVLLYTPPTFGGQVAAKMEVGCASSGEVRGGYSNRSWHGTATDWQPLPEPPHTPQVDKG